jgi:ParB family chromosome partitioning protein
MPGPRKREAEVAVVRSAQPRSTAAAVSGATERRLAGALEVPIEQVAPDPAQPRRDWDHDDGRQRLHELADSIREFGLLQPLLVREEGTLPDGRQGYRIIAGARRRAAAEQAGLTMLPVVVRGAEQARIRVLQLIENLQRQNLSWLDEARAYQELIDTEALTPPTLAARLHISAQHVRDRLRVLADQVLADAVERRQISATAARDIKQLPDEEVMAFRNRVLAGERLQTNDIAAARARLAAAGVINPRRKGSRDAEHPVTMTDAPVPAARAPRIDASDPAPPIAGGPITERPEAAPIRAEDGHTGEDTATEGPNAGERKQKTFFYAPQLAPHEAEAAQAEIGQLVAGLSGPERRRIARLLELAARLGWTIEELARRL